MGYLKKSTQDITLDEAANEFHKVKRSIENLLYKLGDEGDNLRTERDDLDQEYLRSEYVSLLEKLDDVYRRLNYLSKPVTEQGYIKHNELKRYELPSGAYLTSGSTCEILYNDSKYNEQYWIYTSIEHNGDDYYATALGKDISIKGMMIRIRE